MYRQDTTVPRRSCSRGKNTMWRWIYGAQDAYSQRCLKGSPCSLAKITSINSPLSPSFSAPHQTMSSRPLAVKMYNTSSQPAPYIADSWTQTLRFVQSLPKRERQPLSNKFKNADPLGMVSYLLKADVLTRDSHRSTREDASLRSSTTSTGWRRSGT